MPPLRILFMGTPLFALPSLEVLHGSEHKLAAVVTRPDRPRGRGRQVTYSPVKAWALERGVAVEQPSRLKEPAFFNRLKEIEPDLIITVAFGRILPPGLLDYPPRGCINLHASLLPAYRGAAPIQRAIMAGETETGVTIIKMTQELDAGDILLQQREPVGLEDTAGSLHDRLAAKGALLLLQAVDRLSRGDLASVPQDPDRVSHAPPLRPEEEKLDWHSGTLSLHNWIRGMNPWPGAYTTFGSKRLKIWSASPLYRSPEDPAGEPSPGTVLSVNSQSITVAAADGALHLLEVQPEGKRRMSAGSFAAGYRLTAGARLGP